MFYYEKNSSNKAIGQLKASGYKPTGERQIRVNLQAIAGTGKYFQGIIGYEDTVVPDVESGLCFHGTARLWTG